MGHLDRQDMHHQKMKHLCRMLHTNKQTHITHTHLFIPTYTWVNQGAHLCSKLHSKNVHTYSGKTQAHVYTSCRKIGHLDKTHTTKRGTSLWHAAHKQTNTHNKYTHIHFLPAHGSNSQHIYQQKMNIFPIHSTVKTHTYKGKTQAHMCTSCQKMGHLEKTCTTNRWEIFMVHCTAHEQTTTHNT